MAWDCYRLRAAIVDFAEGTLDEPSRAKVERHLSTCADCAAAVLELREVPAELKRRLGHEPGAAFWTRQREEILRAVEGITPATARKEKARRPAPVRWAMVGSFAAAAVAVWVVVGTLSQMPSRPIQVASTDVAASVSSASAPDDPVEATFEVDDTVDDPWSVDEGSLLSLADDLGEDGLEGSEESLI